MRNEIYIIPSVGCVNNVCMRLAKEAQSLVTGNLDGVASREILSILQTLHGEGKTLVMITHDDRIAASAPLQMRMENGRLE